MTLTQILQIEERYLRYEDMRALEYCEKRWEMEGRPIQRWQLINFIEKMLSDLKSSGVGYPKVLLLRKKEIQRRTFTIEVPRIVDANHASASHDRTICPFCYGSGWKSKPTGFAPCDCTAGENPRKELAAMGICK
jgi:hypothetical protein